MAQRFKTKTCECPSYQVSPRGRVLLIKWGRLLLCLTVAIPDRVLIRTHRTPAIGFPELDPSTLAAAMAASAPTSRRAAAAAASLTIANMVASENGTLHMPQSVSLVSQPTPSSSKEKKPKGLFRAPSYPSPILRLRARVSAPTASTAAKLSS